jgi:hypothetical protein
MSSYRPLRFLDASARADEIVANYRLGIGTHSQSSEMHVVADAPEIRVQDDVSEVTETALRITADGGAVSFQSGVDFTNDSKGDIKFQSMLGATTHMTIDGSTGNVGIGTASPSSRLDVTELTNSETTPALTLRRSGVFDYASPNPSVWRLLDIITTSNAGTDTRQCGINLLNYSSAGTGQNGIADRLRTGLGFSVHNENGIVENALVINKDGNVGIGVTNPALALDVAGSIRGVGTTDALMILENTTSPAVLRALTTGNQVYFQSGTASTYDSRADMNFTSMYNGTTYIKIQASTGNFGIGTTNPDEKLDINGGNIKLSVGNSFGADRYIYTHWEDSLNDHQIGLEFDYYAGDGGTGTTHSRINFISNATRDTVINGSGKQTMMSVLSNGNVGIGMTNPTFKLDILGGSTAGTRDTPLRLEGHGSDIVPLINAGSGGGTIKTIAGLEIISIDVPLSTHGRHSYIEAVSAGSTYNTDLEFRARNNGNYQYGGSSAPTTKQARISHNGYIYARVGTSGTGADYAELFEWDDGNQDDEDRTGMTVKLTTGGKIAIADTAENVIGVVSVIYGFLGNDQWDEWVGKYVKDSLGRTVNEDVKMVTWRDENDKECTFKITHVPNDITIPENAVYYTHQSPKINPEYDETKNYMGRSQRKEWSAIGLVGRLRILKGYPKSPRWIKIQDIDENVEEYLAV